ncbi:hypothetical protein GVX76_09135 [[Haemophilus] felis]|nr:hypothetical protein [[Haemophilus] felis]
MLLLTLWEQRKLKNLEDIVTGNTPPTSNDENYELNGFLWVTPTDIKEQITTKTAKQLSDKGKKLARILPPNSILVTCIASIGKNTMITTWGSCNQQINALIPNGKYDPYFLLTQSEFWSKKMKFIAGAGAMNIVNKAQFSEIETHIPTVQEQQKIGSFFTALDRLITTHQRKLENVKNLKKALLQQMFV